MQSHTLQDFMLNSCFYRDSSLSHHQKNFYIFHNLGCEKSIISKKHASNFSVFLCLLDFFNFSKCSLKIQYFRRILPGIRQENY